MSDNFFKNRNGIALGNLASAPSNPKNGDFYYDTTLNKFRRYENGSWGSFGSGSGGSGKNYLTSYTASPSSGVANTGNGDLEGGSTSGFSLGHVSLTSNFPSGVPTFGSGASGNLSLSVIQSGSQIAGSYSLGYVSSAATTAGDFVATDAFYIDAEDQTKVLSFSFAYKAAVNPGNANWSGSSSNSFGIAIWDVTNSAWIQPAGVYNMVQSSGVGSATGSFQVPVNTTQLRFVVYNANATSGAVTVYFDDFVVGPQNSVIQERPVIASYGITSGTTTSQNVPFNFDTKIIDTHAAVTTGSGTWKFTAPVSGVYEVSGTMYNASGGVNTEIDIFKNGSAYAPIGNVSTSTEFQLSPVKVSLNAGDTIDMRNVSGSSTQQGFANGKFYCQIHVVRIPNSSSTEQTDGRVVVAQFAGAPPNTSPGNIIIFPTSNYDTHGAYSTSTGRYTVPVSGFYKVYGYMRVGSSSVPIDVYVNGVSQSRIGVSGSTQDGFLVGGVKCNAGDLIDLRPNVGAGSSTGTSSSWTVNIERASGSQVINANERIAASYYASAIGTTNSSTPVNFDSKVIDTHNAVTTGSGWKFTAPASGIYCLTAVIFPNTNTTAPVGLYKNGSLFIGNVGYVMGASAGDAKNLALIQLNAGDTIDLRGWSTSFQWFGAALTSADSTTINIFRLN